jgi:hypothetical protein
MIKEETTKSLIVTEMSVSLVTAVLSIGRHHQSTYDSRGFLMILCLIVENTVHCV